MGPITVESDHGQKLFEDGGRHNRNCQRRLVGIKGSFASDSERAFSAERVSVEDEIAYEPFMGEIVGVSAGLKAVMDQVRTVAKTDSTVLILGETGTGKELIARAIHNLSSRRSRGFIRADCASIPSGLLESELFGHEKGAYTGAIAREIGRFELANDGTLFLEELGDIPLELQTKLLRVL
jgi:formate hydrogenlyase transcriptional activator